MRTLVLLAPTAIVAFLFCSGCAGTIDERTVDEPDQGAIREQRAGGTISVQYMCDENRCACDPTVRNDCNGMSTYCMNNGGDGLITCSRTDTVCTCDMQ